jgi:hypothetical protein
MNDKARPEDASTAAATQDATAASALIGEPTGDSLSRRRVDDLEFSAAQQKRPGGMSRPEYLRSRPGETTRQLAVDAGMLVSRRRLGIMFAVGGVALIVALLMLFSFFWL